MLWEIEQDARRKLTSEDDYDLRTEINNIHNRYYTEYEKKLGQIIDGTFLRTLESNLNWHNFMQVIEHYAGFPPEIFDRIVFGYKRPHNLFDEMKIAEEAWAKKHAGLMPYRKDDHIIKSFPDGMTWIENVNGQ